MVSLAERRGGAERLEAKRGVSERRAFQLIGIWCSSKRRPSGRVEEATLIRRIYGQSERYPKCGCRKSHAILRAEGAAIGRDRLRLILKRECLQVPLKQRKPPRAGKSTTEEDRALYPKHVWSYDFVSDQTADGPRLRFLAVIDEFTREAIWIECARLLNSHDVLRVLDQLVEIRGHPRIIKSNNGPEFVAERIQGWARTDPPTRSSSSPEALDKIGITNRSKAFLSVRKARMIVESWRREYNEARPHRALDQTTPAAYAAGVEQEGKRHEVHANTSNGSTIQDEHEEQDSEKWTN
jgi:putative transposase